MQANFQGFQVVNFNQDNLAIMLMTLEELGNLENGY